jgi:hypothetical protein
VIAGGRKLLILFNLLDLRKKCGKLPVIIDFLWLLSNEGEILDAWVFRLVLERTGEYFEFPSK